jgi:hypothetical protein
MAARVCEDCGDEPGSAVIAAGGRVRLLEGHQCRDYIAWHQPPDRRDPLVVDVPDGWRPRKAGALAA